MTIACPIPCHISILEVVPPSDKYDYLWLYGLVEPITGENFFEEWSHLNSDCDHCYNVKNCLGIDNWLLEKEGLKLSY